MAKVSGVAGITRVFLWLVIMGLAVASAIIFYNNYTTLEQAVVFSEESAEKQAKNVRYYVNEYHVTKIALDESNQKLLEMTQNLEQANHDLTLTRDELTSVQQINDQLKVNIASLERYKERARSKGEALETMISSFKKKNYDLDMLLQGVRKELAVFNPEVSNTKEGRDKVRLFKEQIHKVKQSMAGLRLDALNARISAQKEKDRLESIYGNGGYMMRNGEDKSVSRPGGRRVDIDVKFIER